MPYGEPARISCVIHFGDGDIADVERKVELGGNLHAKGMMIMQAFVSSALNLDGSLPFLLRLFLSSLIVKLMVIALHWRNYVH